MIQGMAERRMLELMPISMRRRLLQRDIWVLRETRRNPWSDYSIADLDRHRCIFFHVPKTAGVSISRALFGSLAAGHIDIATAKLVFGTYRFDRYFKFCFVRNPWDRLVSAFVYLRGGGMEANITPWAELHIASHTFESFVREELNQAQVLEERHLRPQHSYVCERGDVAVDFVGRFENLESDYRQVAEHLDIEAELPKLNMTQRDDYRVYYNLETRSIVEDVYSRDIEIFGYEF